MNLPAWKGYRWKSYPYLKLSPHLTPGIFGSDRSPRTGNLVCEYVHDSIRDIMLREALKKLQI